MIFNEYSLGLISLYKLTKQVHKTKNDKKLDVEYFKEDGQHFMSYLINNEISEGFKHFEFIDDSYYELTIHRLTIPHSNKHRLNVEFDITTINKAQELSVIRLFSTVRIDLPRLLDRAILQTLKTDFDNYKHDILELHRAGQIPDYKDRDTFPLPIGIFMETGKEEIHLRGCF